MRARLQGGTAGIFSAPKAALAAARKLKAEGFDSLALMSPVPVEGVEDALGKKKSVIKRFTLIGAIFGALGGVAIAVATAVHYLQPAGGRPIIAIPTVLIISYETAILCGILATVIGFLISARLPVIRERVYLPDASVDRFVLTVACDHGAKLQRASAILRSSGADEVRDIEADR